MADRVGQQIGNYRLDRLLGSGGFAEVYLGVHIHLGTQVASKLLHTHFATPGELEQFRTEAQTIAPLQHPHIVRVLDFGVEEGTPYLLLDYAPNGSLRSHFPPGSPLPPTTILPAVLQVAGALQYAHDHQLVHRDVKPENLLLGRTHEVLLTDFGIATVAQNTSQQRTQGVAGTAAYMAPEQLQGKPRPASDLYALGVVVYEWLCGERPFVGGPLEVATQHLTMQPPPLREKVATIPQAVEQVVLTALAKDPKERFGNVRAFANAFSQACGEAGNAYVLSTQAILPLPSAPVPAQPQPSQGAAPVQAAASIFSATTHFTPQRTPSMSTGASLSSAETRLISPASASSVDMGGATTGGTIRVTAPATLPAQGWAAQVPPAGADDSLPATAEVAYQKGGSAAASDERTLADASAPPGTPGRGKASTGRRKGGVRRWVLAAACLLLLALIGSGVIYGLPLIHFGSTARSGPTAVPAATGATVTITPASSDVKNTFNLAGVTGTPDATQQQVGARVISITTQAQSKTVSATGQGTPPATHASGTLQVYNNDDANPLTLAAGWHPLSRSAPYCCHARFRAR